MDQSRRGNDFGREPIGSVEVSETERRKTIPKLDGEAKIEFDLTIMSLAMMVMTPSTRSSEWA
jgi:hypothetical protein